MESLDDSCSVFYNHDHAHNDNHSLSLVPVASSSSHDGLSPSSRKRKRGDEENKKEKVPITNNLCQAALNGSLSSVKALHQAGVSLDSRETEDVNHPYYNMTPLAFAMIRENGDVVRYLLKQNANPNLTFRKDKTTLLMYATRNGVHISEDGKFDEEKADYFYYICEALLKKGANVNAMDSDGFTALHWIYYLYDIQPFPRNDGNSSRFIELLLKYGADKNICNKVGESVVDLYNRSMLFTTAF